MGPSVVPIAAVGPVKSLGTDWNNLYWQCAEYCRLPQSCRFFWPAQTGILDMALLSVTYPVPVHLHALPPRNVPFMFPYCVMKAQRILGTPLSKIYLSSFALEEVKKK